MLNETGVELTPGQSLLAQHVAAVHQAGRQAAIHAIGPEAIAAALDAIELTQARDGISNPHRIEHASITSERLSLRMAALGTVAVSNPAFIRQNGDRYLHSVRSADLPHLYDVALMRRSGVVVAGGSDCPIAPPEPLVGIAAACSRCSASGRRIPGETLDRNSALELFTSSAARVALEDQEKGSLREGLLADIVILEETPEGLRVRMTILGGKVAWAADGFSKRLEASPIAEVV
jgi:predicted amidohydrolase YtcJ